MVTATRMLQHELIVILACSASTCLSSSDMVTTINLYVVRDLMTAHSTRGLADSADGAGCTTLDLHQQGLI